MKKNKYIYILSLLLSITMLSACKDEFEPYDHPFFHIHVANRSTVEVAADRNDQTDYKVYFSTKLQFEPVDLKYEVIVGNGLLAGRDFELITQGNTLNFPNGIFERPVTIKWIAAPVDATKNNTITIRLLSNSKNYTIGLPGPDQLQKELIITKK
ncbi:hypothetical protein [Pedobacter chitinilyticus]|uniref:DUF4843 domain-containing protein n=1 Tax=Pedobacter chitinilyticus TaxID=2233776 RepID=A0A3S3QE78_9SPHI|nr:hypothetical protein [Pedobacter chitinilyticus]RWU04858.1 hypothetical protein DPV69_16980 [Pedobacter chitinilyticus]